MTRPGYTRSNSYGRGLLKNSKPSALKLSKGAHKTSPTSKNSTKRDSRNTFEEDDMAGLPNYWYACTYTEARTAELTLSQHHVREADYHTQCLAALLLRSVSASSFCVPSMASLTASSCRRKDGNRPISECLETGFPSPSPIASYDAASSYPDIVPQRSPSVMRPSSIASEDSSIYERPQMSRADSEAAQYLSQFLSASSSSPARRSARAGYYRNQNTASHSTLPSLSHTPGSFASPPSSYSSVSRTAPNRPVYWNSHRHHSSTRSIDLVMPVTASASVNKTEGEASLRSHASTATAFPVAEGELTYEKKPMAEASHAGSGSLKQLFAHEAMRRSPNLRYNFSSSSLSKHHSTGDD